MVLVYGFPVLLAMLMTLGGGDSTLLPWVLTVMVPGLAVSIPLGQGMIVSAYEQRRASLPHAGSTHGVPLVPRRLTTISMGLLAVATGTLLLLLSVLAFQPAPPADAIQQMEREPAVSARASVETHVLLVPQSRVDIHVGRNYVAIRTTDAGGAGEIPLGDRRVIQRVDVWEEVYGYRVGISDSIGRRDVLITGAGVRLDDGFDRRLTSHVALWEIWVMLGTLLLGAWVLAWAVLPLGDIRRPWRLWQLLAAVWRLFGGFGGCLTAVGGSPWRLWRLWELSGG